jgi:uncharacterized membrane protein
MELLILLIVIALILCVLLGPIGFFKANNNGIKLESLEKQVHKLSIELRDTRSLALKLYDAYRAGEQSPSATADIIADLMAEQDTKQSAPAEQPAEVAEPVEEAPVSETPIAEPPEEPIAEAKSPTIDKQTTLQHLRDLRQQHQDKEQAPQPEETEPETPAKAASEEPEKLVEDKAAVDVAEPVTSNVATHPPEEQHETEEAPMRRLTIEEVLAGKVFVWIGAIALVLTAAFLLKLGFDSGIITEQVRVIAAGVFGVVLWCVGEWARKRVSLIAQALCGAGVAVLYGTIIAADHYQLLGPSNTIAFGLMALVTAAAVVLSLRHGPAVAILGMLGGFMMPPLLVENMSPTLGMVLYLIAIEVGVLAVTGKRGWFGISLMTLIFSVVWSIGYTLIGDNATERTLTAMLVLGTAAAYIFHTARIHSDPAADGKTKLRMLGLSIAATCSAIAVTAVLAVKGDYSLQDLSMLGVVALGTLVLARIDARQIAMPFVAMALSALVLLANAAQSLPAPPSDMLIAMCAGFGGLFLLGGYVCMWGSSRRRAFAVMCAIAGPAFYGIVYFAGHEAYGYRELWWPYTLCLAGIYALATLPMLLRRKAEHDWAIALFSVLSFALVCVSLGQALDHPWFAVSLTGVSAAAALIDLRLFIRPLRLAAAIVAFVSAGLLVVPGPFDLLIHGGPIFNTLLPMYLLPAIAFAIIAWSAARAGSSITAGNLTWLCMATLAAMLLVLTRDIYQPAEFMAESFALYEWSTYATVLLLAGLLSHAVGRKLHNAPILHGTRCLVGIGAILGLTGGLIPSNPLFQDELVGGITLAAGLLALYAAPAALMWLWSRRPSIAEVPALAEALRIASIALTTIFVGLQIRNGFAPDDLRGSAIGMYEFIVYAVAWLLMGGFIQRFNKQHLQSAATRVAGQVVFVLALVITLVGSIVVFNPLIDPDAVGGWGLAGRMVVLYVLPAVLLWLWSRGQTLADQRPLINILRGASIVFLAIFAGQLIRNAYQTDNLHALSISMFECTTYGLAWIALGFALHIIAPRCTLPQTTGSVGRTVFGIGLTTLVLGNVLVLNPLWFRATVGSMPVLNGLWYLYGPLILILALIARHARHHGLTSRAKLAGFTAVGLSFMLLSMLVRHGFSGDGYVLIQGNLGPAERYAYSLAWVVFGGVLLVAGVFTRLDTLRYGSLAVLLLAVGKVFLIDTANLEDLYRVFSFLGLGVTLIGLGYLYQRLVFKRPAAPTKAQAA